MYVISVQEVHSTKSGLSASHQWQEFMGQQNVRPPVWKRPRRRHPSLRRNHRPARPHLDSTVIMGAAAAWFWWRRQSRSQQELSAPPLEPWKQGTWAYFSSGLAIQRHGRHGICVYDITLRTFALLFSSYFEFTVRHCEEVSGEESLNFEAGEMNSIKR